MKKAMFELPLELWKKAVKKAKREGMTFSFLLRKLLRDYVKKGKK